MYLLIAYHIRFQMTQEKVLERSRKELCEHLVSELWLAARDHVSGVAHDKEAQIGVGASVHAGQVAHGLAIDPVHVAVGVAELIDAGPGAHLVEHLQDAGVVADDVHVAVVDQSLSSSIRLNSCLI